MERLALIPYPKEIKQHAGAFQIGDETRIYLAREVEKPERLAARQLAGLIEDKTAHRPPVDRPGLRPVEEKGCIFLRLSDGGARDGQEYRLSIKENFVEAVSPSLAGLFLAMQTLKQLVRQHGGALPCMEISDSPDYPVRGVYFDISRGRVPRLETLKWLIDWLAEQKINMFQLYVEHAFEFRFNPRINWGLDALAPEDVLVLDDYCAERRIDFVPSLASFGHMGGVLSLPEYRHLADVELEKGWHDLDWQERMVGATLNMNDPEALELLEKMHDCFTPLFRSKFLNVCADETFDLGTGKNKEAAEKEGKASLYLRHINWLNDLSKRYGRKMMFWGDVILQHPDAIADLPKDAICLNWDYFTKEEYDSCRLFQEAGVEFYVCPGNSGWNRISNAVENADQNIRRFARDGKKYGATGLLNTDWGDYGHYNLLAGSLHGFSLGASMAWNVETPGAEEFDAIWNVYTLGEEDGEGAAALREMSRDGHLYLPTWRYFFYLFDDDRILNDIEESTALKLIQDSRHAERVFSAYRSRANAPGWIANELLHMSEVNGLFGEKYLLASEWREARKDPERRTRELALRFDAFANRVDQAITRYRELWLDLHRESDLGRIQMKFDFLAADARRIAREIDPDHKVAS